MAFLQDALFHVDTSDDFFGLRQTQAFDRDRSDEGHGDGAIVADRVRQADAGGQVAAGLGHRDGGDLWSVGVQAREQAFDVYAQDIVFVQDVVLGFGLPQTRVIDDAVVGHGNRQQFGWDPRGWDGLNGRDQGGAA